MRRAGCGAWSWMTVRREGAHLLLTKDPSRAHTDMQLGIAEAGIEAGSGTAADGESGDAPVNPGSGRRHGTFERGEQRAAR